MFTTCGTRADHRTTLLRGRARGPLRNIGNSETTKTVDFQHAPFSRLVMTLTGNVTLTLQRPVDGGTYAFLVKTGTGGFTATWPSNVSWPQATTPTVTVTASRIDLFTFIYDQAADKYYGSFNQSYS